MHSCPDSAFGTKSCALTSVGFMLRMPSPQQHEPGGRGDLEGGSAGPRGARVRKGRNESGRLQGTQRALFRGGAAADCSRKGRGVGGPSFFWIGVQPQHRFGIQVYLGVVREVSLAFSNKSSAVTIGNLRFTKRF